MKGNWTILALLPGLLAVPLVAQPQIGGGTCSSATLSGNYSATVTGRGLSSTATFTSTSQAIGAAVFDGLSKVTFSLTANTNKAFGTAQTLSGTYTLQANCVGSVTITTGDSATFTLEAYNGGKSYLIIGQDGTYAFTGSGSVLPATCPASLTAGTYPVNGTGLGLTSGAISSAIDVIGVLIFNGTNTVAMNIVVATNGSTKNVSATGTYSLASNCSATASLTDSSGNSYALVLEFTAATGNNFLLSSANATAVFNGSGRAL